MPTFHVLLATIGRPSLQKMIDSLKPELVEGDHLTIVFDGVQRNHCDISNMKCNTHIYEENTPLGYWGHGIRNKYAPLLEQTDFVMHADDDDIYIPGSFSFLRTECCDHKTLYIAQMKSYIAHTVYPLKDDVCFENIGTPMGIIPYNHNQHHEWGLFYGGDGYFYENISKVANIVWLKKIIYLIKPANNVKITDLII